MYICLYKLLENLECNIWDNFKPIIYDILKRLEIYIDKL